MKKQPVTFIVTINTELSLRELQSLEKQMRSKGHTVDTSITDRLKNALTVSPIERTSVDDYLTAIDRIDVAELERVFLSASSPLTPTDKLYILCFMISMPTDDLCKLFHIEPASTYVVRYRIRHKFPDKIKLPF